jgi:hypothetical protein
MNEVIDIHRKKTHQEIQPMQEEKAILIMNRMKVLSAQFVAVSSLVRKLMNKARRNARNFPCQEFQYDGPRQQLNQIQNSE